MSTIKRTHLMGIMTAGLQQKKRKNGQHPSSALLITIEGTNRIPSPHGRMASITLGAPKRGHPTGHPTTMLGTPKRGLPTGNPSRMTIKLPIHKARTGAQATKHGTNVIIATMHGSESRSMRRSDTMPEITIECLHSPLSRLAHQVILDYSKLNPFDRSSIYPTCIRFNNGSFEIRSAGHIEAVLAQSLKRSNSRM